MEFQAVVMAAGKGSRMTDLTSEASKALLPIANKPMLWYPLNMLAKAGFTEAIIVVSQTEQAEVQKVIAELDLTIQLEYVTVKDEEDLGTADSLRLPELRNKIKSDMLIISCDLVTDLPLHLLADVHRTNNATITMLLAPALDTSEIAVPGSKANKKIEQELIGMDAKGNRVLFLSSLADLDESISFRKSFFKKFPYVNMQTKLTDAHLYLMKKSIFGILDQNSHINSIRGELIPYLIKRQYQSKKSSPETEPNDLSRAEKDIDSGIDELMQSAMEMSAFSHHGDKDEIRCYAQTAQDWICLRANSLLAYCEANRQVPRILHHLTKDPEVKFVHPGATIAGKTQVGADSMLGDGTTIGEKCSVKRSIVGKNCKIADRIKISNSIIMDGVTLKEGCVISGCIICDNAKIDEKCDLKDCIVGASQAIKFNGSKYQNEALVVDHMMEI